MTDPQRCCTRRLALEAGLLASLGTVLPGVLWASESAPGPLIERRVPADGRLVPVMGIGTNAFNMSNYNELRAVLERMHALGGRMIDTAAMYGDSEAVIGRALAELGIREQMFVATKFNAQGAARGGFSGGGGPYGQASFERSLMRLRTDHVDLLYAHFLPSVEPLMPLLTQLKLQGKTRYIGITTASRSEHPQLLEAMRRHPIDFVQVDYSLANRDAAASVFPVALERKIAVVIDLPLGGHFGSLLKEVGDRPLPPWAKDLGISSWSQFFLKYVVSHPAVTCAIPGASKVDHVSDDQLAGHGPLPDAAQRRRMETYWDTKA
jgi:aryl-alcohol dehydrogenase-like predicted oxidoreductase